MCEACESTERKLMTIEDHPSPRDCLLVETLQGRSRCSRVFLNSKKRGITLWEQ